MVARPFTTQFAEPYSVALLRHRHPNHTVGRRCRRVSIHQIKAHMHVIDAKTELIAQYAGRTNVSGNHRFFDDTVRNPDEARRRYPALAPFTPGIKAVIRAIFKTPLRGYDATRRSIGKFALTNGLIQQLLRFSYQSPVFYSQSETWSYTSFALD